MEIAEWWLTQAQKREYLPRHSVRLEADKAQFGPAKERVQNEHGTARRSLALFNLYWKCKTALPKVPMEKP